MLVAQAGKVVCAGIGDKCSGFLGGSDVAIVDLGEGAISPGLVSFGSNLGLEEIELEASTRDGEVSDPLGGDAPNILGEGAVIQAVDGLQFATRHA